MEDSQAGRTGGVRSRSGWDEGGRESCEGTVTPARQAQPAVVKQRQLLCPPLRALEVPRLRGRGEEVSTPGVREREEGFG